MIDRLVGMKRVETVGRAGYGHVQRNIHDEYQVLSA